MCSSPSPPAAALRGGPCCRLGLGEGLGGDRLSDEAGPDPLLAGAGADPAGPGPLLAGTSTVSGGNRALDLAGTVCSGRSPAWVAARRRGAPCRAPGPTGPPGRGSIGHGPSSLAGAEARMSAGFLGTARLPETRHFRSFGPSLSHKGPHRSAQPIPTLIEGGATLNSLPRTWTMGCAMVPLATDFRLTAEVGLQARKSASRWGRRASSQTRRRRARSPSQSRARGSV